MDAYRQIYAPSCFSVRQDPSPIEDILQPWDKAKRPLYEILKGKFIYETEVSYDISQEVISRLIDETFYQYDFNLLSPIFNAVRLYNKDCHDDDILVNVVTQLISPQTLAKNKYSGPAVSLDLPDGKTLTIPFGCKPIKMLGKIINKFNITEVMEDFEVFRLKHSRILSTKEIKGTLCLSIHPMDYMTMSDNKSDWHTCMSWMEEGGGEYKQGTVEMMNSPYIVVAYLKSNTHDFHPTAGKVWNNKKWRQLFVIKPNYALSIRSYPYESSELTKQVLEVIKELMGWDGPIYDFLPRETNKYGSQKVTITPLTGAMYNDFGRCSHFITINPEHKDDIDEELIYSGISECMYCGDTTSDWYHEKMLCCEDCVEVYKCAYCDELHSSRMDGYYLPNGDWVCDNCYEDETLEDDITGNRIYRNESRAITLSHSNEEPEIGLFGDLSIHTALNDSELSSYFSKIESFNDNWVTVYVVRPADCSEDGLDLFGLNEKRLKIYMEE